MRRVRGSDGFTLIEILVVILIIGVLAAIAIPAFLNQRQKGKDASAVADLRNAVLAQETYHTEHDRYTILVSDLAQIEPTLSTARLGWNGIYGRFNGPYTDPNEYNLEAWTDQGSTASTGHWFYYHRYGDGSVARWCNPPGKGLCRSDGTWK